MRQICCANVDGRTFDCRIRRRIGGWTWSGQFSPLLHSLIPPLMNNSTASPSFDSSHRSPLPDHR